MKRILTFAAIAVAIGLIGRIMLNADAKPTQAQALVIQPAAATMTPIPTQTIIPSATIGYQDTAVVAMQTANEASRVNAMITAEFEQRAQEQLQLTAAAEYQYFVVLGWTATSAPTSVVLTATAQANYNTQVSGQQTLEAGRLTATAKAPTLIVAIADSENHAKHVETAYILEWILKLSLAFFMVAIGAFMIWKMRTVTAADIVKQELTTEYRSNDPVTVTIRDEKDPAKTEHYVFPCTDEQLTELAEMVMNGERTFGYNRMETKSRTFKNQRDVLEKTRAILEKAKLAVNTHNGESVINDRGVAFFEDWFDSRVLPENFEIGETE